jgi:UDP-N-acetylmuramoylalanine--D-glutamate ligase
MNVLVLGLGSSGRASAEKLHALGAGVLVNDAGDNPALREAAGELERMGVSCLLGAHPPEVLQNRDLVVVSPGIPGRHPLLNMARERGIPVWSEIELAWRLIDLPVIAITGTNGKTTTVHMVEAVLRKGGLRVKVAGNIGYPLTRAVDEQAGYDWLLTEVSSFQLFYIVDFAPRIAVILNITDDHFDWHRDFEEYLRSKALIWKNQEADDWLVCNLDDPGSVRSAEGAPSRLLYYSKVPDPRSAVYVDAGVVKSRFGLRGREVPEEVGVMRADEIPLPGKHNLENALAAVSVGLLLGVTPKGIREALVGFQGLPHRLQLVAEVGGVKFYDDSKATNPDAALKAVETFDNPLVLILGGRNKGLSFDLLARTIASRWELGMVRGVVLMGEAAAELAESLGACTGGMKIYEVKDMGEAVGTAREIAHAGDVVLLTPACASFDQYGSYAERGDHFQELVKGLSGGVRGE